MSCNIVAYSTCIIDCLCKVLVVCGIKCITGFNYIVCVIRITITCSISRDIVIEVITGFLYIRCFIYLIVIKHIS